MSPADLIRAWSAAERKMNAIMRTRPCDAASAPTEPDEWSPEYRSYIERFSAAACAESLARRELHAWADAHPAEGTHCPECGLVGCAVCGRAA